MDDETRVQYEGFRPGMYVRVEVSPKIDVLILLTLSHRISCFVSAEKLGVHQVNENYLAMYDYMLVVMYFGNIAYLLAHVNNFRLSHQLNGMPCEFVTNFDAKYPVILGGLLSSEDTMGFIQVSFCSFHVSFFVTFSPV